MRRCFTIRRGITACTWFATALAAGTTWAAQDGQLHASASVPVAFLLAKSWLIGYVIVGLAILLGLLAVLIPSLRKIVGKKN